MSRAAADLPQTPNGEYNRGVPRQLVAKGKTNHEIAHALNLGEGTVRNCVSNILGKLDMANRAEAAAHATKHNLEGLS